MRIQLLILSLVCLSCFATPEQVARQAAALRSVLQQADEAYYNAGDPIMSDAAYDALREQYEELRGDYPDLPDLFSVGADVPDMDSPVPHTRPMLSLKKAYSDQAVADFLKKCGTNETYCVEPKIDGLTVVLRYREGKLVRALTRGDGLSGMDVTPQIMATGCVPLVLTNAPAVLEVRGEVFMPFDAFETLNVRRRQAGQNPLKSPRNSAAGTLRMKDLSEVAQRGLACCIFDVVEIDFMPQTQINGLTLALGWGFPVVECHAVSGCEVVEQVNELNLKRAGLPFPTDGIVIRLNDCAAFQRMGMTARYPNGALARKYKSVPVETRLIGVEWTRGDTGRLTPVALFEPVDLNGATLERASLHSLDHLRALDLMIGDRIQVIRAGGTVPEIVGRCPGPRTGDEKPVPDPAGTNP